MRVAGKGQHNASKWQCCCHTGGKGRKVRGEQLVEMSSRGQWMTQQELVVAMSLPGQWITQQEMVLDNTAKHERGRQPTMADNK